MKNLALLLALILATAISATAQTPAAALTNDDWQNALKLAKKDMEFAKLDKAAGDADKAANAANKPLQDKLYEDKATINMKVDALTSAGMDGGAARASVEANDATTMADIASLQKQIDTNWQARDEALKARGQKLIQMLPAIDPRFAPVVADAQKLIQDNWSGTPNQ